MNNIDPELAQALSTSEWTKIAYDDLLKTNPAQIRIEEAQLASRETVLPRPKGLEVENRIVMQENHSIRLRIYRPTGKLKKPILLYFHGGGFIFGSSEQYDFLFYRLAIDAQITIVSVDYRLAPEHPFPAALHDGYAALKWVKANSNLLDGDANKIMVGGSSAGGTIALSLSHYSRDLGDNCIQFLYILYPPTDNRLTSTSMQKLAHAPMQTKESARWMWHHYLRNSPNKTPRYAVPLREMNYKLLPPTHLVVCELDPFIDEGLAYAKRLRENNVEVHVHQIQGAVHAFDFFECKLSEEFYRQQVDLFKHLFH